MRVIVAGSSGLVGTELISSLLRDGHSVVRLLRPGSTAQSSGSANEAMVEWLARSANEARPFGNDQDTVEGADAVVNLAGASIAGGRWTEERKALLRSSRVQTTRQLVAAIGSLRNRPRVLVSASAIGYYGDRGDEVLTEESKPGRDFLSGVAQEWEAEAVKAETLGMRAVRARFGVILSKNGGALKQMMRQFQLGVGGRLGSGRQWMSWVTLEDVVGILRWTLEGASLAGAVNVVAPQPVRNAEFTEELAQAMRRPAIFPAPAFALRLALGEMADALLLSSQQVKPARLEQAGYRFLHPDLPNALTSLLRAG